MANESSIMRSRYARNNSPPFAYHLPWFMILDIIIFVSVHACHRSIAFLPSSLCLIIIISRFICPLKNIYIRVIPPFILPQKYFSFISFRVPFNLRVKSKEKRTRRWNYSLKISYPDIFLFLFLEIFEIYFIVSFNLHVKWRKSRAQGLEEFNFSNGTCTYVHRCIRTQLNRVSIQHNLRLIVDRCLPFRISRVGVSSGIVSPNKSVADRIIPPPSNRIQEDKEHCEIWEISLWETSNFPAADISIPRKRE